MSGRRSKLHLLDGRHPFKTAVPGGYVDYPVRRRTGGRVLLFNFDLAREIGLLPSTAPDVLDSALRGEILRTFGLEIVNEYDCEHDPDAARRAGPRRYMATRYLQLQHPGRQGRTSGDGRSVWNGVVGNGAERWDISSCGTGATSLSPATAMQGRYFRSGDRTVSYGCGRAFLWDAFCAALMSDILHRNGVRTERTLAIIDYGDGSCIAVRVYRNLMRPAHLFLWLKQNDHARLKAAADYYIRRECEDGRWPRLASAQERYQYLLERVTADFAAMAARFESEYIFCWLDWDGDNILLDGGIIDYGSVRQFGLFHREYRYDDVDRLSTTITEQRFKARHIVQTMAQLTDFLLSGKRKPLASFRHAPAVVRFDELFARQQEKLLIDRIGFAPALQESLLKDRSFMQQLRVFAPVYRRFERTSSARGVYEVSDGITRDAVFCMRDLLRELPGRYLDGASQLAAEEFIELMRSEYAEVRDVRLYPHRRAQIVRFQRAYVGMVERAALLDGCSRTTMLRRVRQRSIVLNRSERITGDGVLVAARKLLRNHNAMSHKELYDVFQGVVEDQSPHFPSSAVSASPSGTAGGDSCARLRGAMLKAIREHRQGL